MRSKEILIQIVEYLDLFEKENKHLTEYNFDDVINFIQSQEFSKKEFPDKKYTFEKGGKYAGLNLKESKANSLSRLLSLNYRYAKDYIKKALEGSQLQTVEEFSYLIVLMTNDHLSKTELILENAMAKTSGTEVIKRLLRKELITQFDDKKDKRSQLVAISPKGLEEMKKVFPKMQMASDIISGNLNQSEQQTLNFLLKKLEAHHNDLFINHRVESLDQLFDLGKEN